MLVRFATVACLFQYFDDRGKEIKPYCNAGKNCRFILSRYHSRRVTAFVDHSSFLLVSFLHPGDPGWAHSPRRQNYSPAHRDTRHRPRPNDDPPSPSSNRRRLPPLAPQSELFIRENPDIPDTRDDKDRAPHYGRDDRRDDHSTNQRPNEMPLHPRLKTEERPVNIEGEPRQRHIEVALCC